jgi:hypothetical protein
LLRADLFLYFEGSIRYVYIDLEQTKLIKCAVTRVSGQCWHSSIHMLNENKSLLIYDEWAKQIAFLFKTFSSVKVS